MTAEASKPSPVRSSLQRATSIGEAVLQIDLLLSLCPVVGMMDVGIEEARLEAELLVSHVLGTDRTHLLANLGEPLPADALASLVPLIERRLLREPLSYLLGWREFYGLRFAVRPGVLIPRHETETLVDEALRLARERYNGVPLIADLGCGSGVIAVSLALHLLGSRIYAMDNAPSALEVAEENCKRYDVQERVPLLKGDLLIPLPEPVDMIVANLPYVRSGDFPTLQPEVLYEPREALDGGPDGLQIILKLLDQLPGRVRPGGALLLECDPSQVQCLKRQALRRHPDSSVQVVQDLDRLDRVIEVFL